MLEDSRWMKPDPCDTVILMATYNGEKFLREQIDSILQQTCSDWTLVISDDGSNDGTPSIIAEYAARYPGRIVQHHSGRHFGNARDHFLYLMKAFPKDYVLFCDQDDSWYPEKVGKLLEALRSEEQKCGPDMPILVFSDQVPVDARKKPLGSSLMSYQKQYTDAFDYRSIIMQNVVTGGSMAINHSLARLAEACLDESGTIMHDWWLAIVAARFGKIIYIDEPLGIYRQHGNNVTGAKNVGSLAYVLDRLFNIKNARAAILRKKAQAAVFRESYQDQLSGEDIRFLEEFEKETSGLVFYWRYRRLIHTLSRKIGMALLG